MSRAYGTIASDKGWFQQHNMDSDIYFSEFRKCEPQSSPVRKIATPIENVSNISQVYLRIKIWPILIVKPTDPPTIATLSKLKGQTINVLFAMSAREIYYSDKYYDDVYEYRHVILPKDISRKDRRDHLLRKTNGVRVGFR
jgi:accessory colonization factor AcfC